MTMHPVVDPSQSGAPPADVGGDTATTDAHPIGSNLMRPWLVANFVAFTIGGAVGGGVLRTIGEPYYGSDISAIEAARVQALAAGAGAAVFGAVLGVAQWLVLRRVIRAGWWLPATCVGWALAGAVGGFNSGGSVSTIGPAEGPMPSLLFALVALPLVVLLLGGAQWLVLRREFERPGTWLLINVVALFVAFGAGFVIAKLAPWLAPTDFPSAQALGLVGAVAGVVYGYLTWIYLAELRGRGV